MRSLRDRLQALSVAAKLWKLPTDRDPVPAGYELPELRELQTWVRGYIELVHLDADGLPFVLICDEDGAGPQGVAPFNEHASRFYQAGVGSPVAFTARCHVLRLVPFRIHGPAWLWIGALPPDA